MEEDIAELEQNQDLGAHVEAKRCQTHLLQMGL